MPVGVSTTVGVWLGVAVDVGDGVIGSVGVGVGDGMFVGVGVSSVGAGVLVGVSEGGGATAGRATRTVQ